MSQPPKVPPRPVPSAPPSLAHALRGLFVVRGAAPRPRWPFALRTTIAMGVPVLVGWLAGDVQAGLMATIGGFTGLYGNGRPYPSRARELAIIAVAFAVAVGLGLAMAAWPWTIVPTLALFAMAATWLCNALKVGPPGAYMFMLACAAGTAMPAAHISPAHAAVLVFAGGAFAWLLHMAGVLWRPRGPEASAVAAAAHAVAGFIEAIGTPREDDTRQRAALAMRDAWSALVDFQPARTRPDGRLARLRVRNRELHLLFADAMGCASRQQPPPAGAQDAARRIAQQAGAPAPVDAVPVEDLPLGHPGPVEAMREEIRPGSLSLRVIVRVGVATLVAGWIGAALGLDRAYWAMAAAVLMLHQGFDWMRMVQRSSERLLGTWVGLLLAGGILAWSPQGLWLVATIMALQFTIEMAILRNYALAAVFITGAALLLAGGGHPVVDLRGLLMARGVDTAVGCAVALLVYALIAPRAAAARIPDALVRALEAVEATAAHLAGGCVTTAPARVAQRDLQHRSFALAQAYDAAVVASRQQRGAAEAMWPAIAATQRLAYRTLSACWAMERIGGDAAREAAHSMFGDGGQAQLHEALARVAAAIRDGEPPAALPGVPTLFAAELANLHESLTGPVRPVE